MKLFSQRKGLKSIRETLQVNQADSALRARLWNNLTFSFWDHAIEILIVRQTTYGGNRLYVEEQKAIDHFFQFLWDSYFKKPIDTLPDHWRLIISEIRKYFFDCPWNEVYDLIELINTAYPYKAKTRDFINACNQVFKEEQYGYRFVGGIISEITSEEEIAEVEEALSLPDSLKPVSNHMRKSLDLFSNRESPDFRNSIKESISAVEAICQLITAEEKATLGKTLRLIGGKVKVHSALKEAFDRLYGWTSDADGIRHALLEESELDLEDAKFMLVSCSAFINYLKVKATKAGIF